MQTGSLPPTARLGLAICVPARFPQLLALDHGDLHRCNAMLRERRAFALALMAELRGERDRLKRVAAVTAFITSAFAGLALGVCTGSLVLETFAPFEPSRPTLPTLWERTG